MAGGAIPLGHVSGEGPAGGGVVLGLAVAAMLAGCLGGAALPALGAAFVVARFYTYDPYYLPTLRRMSDGGLFSPAWIFGLAAAALATSLLTAIRPRAGRPIAVVVLLACVFTALFESAGH